MCHEILRVVQIHANDHTYVVLRFFSKKILTASTYFTVFLKFQLIWYYDTTSVYQTWLKIDNY